MGFRLSEEPGQIKAAVVAVFPARSITIEIEKENGPDKIGAATSLSKLLASYLLLISFLASAIEPTGG